MNTLAGLLRSGESESSDTPVANERSSLPGTTKKGEDDWILVEHDGKRSRGFYWSIDIVYICFHFNNCKGGGVGGKGFNNI